VALSAVMNAEYQCSNFSEFSELYSTVFGMVRREFNNLPIS